MLSQCAKTAEHGVRTRPGRKLQIHWRDEIVERRKVAVVQPQFAQELPDSLDRIELRAVGRKEKQDELGLLLSAPLGMHGGVVIPCVVHDNEHSPTSMPTASAQLAQEGPACLGIKTAFGLGDHQTSVTYPHRAEVADAFAPCHYPHLVHLPFKVSNPSHIHIKRCQPRQIVCQPGIPSCLRARKPPSRAVATSTF